MINTMRILYGNVLDVVADDVARFKFPVVPK